MVRNGVKEPSLKGEGGAVSVKAILIVAFLGIAALLLVKLVPVYVEQQEIEHETDEWARKAAMGINAYSKDKVEKELEYLIQQHGLPEGSIQLASLESNRAEISVKYTRSVDLLLTSYSWDVDYKAVGKGI